MKAIRIHGRGGPEHLVYEDAPQPHPGPEEVLVRVAATAVIVNELTWDVTYQSAEGMPRLLPVPGHDFSGMVAEVGAHARDVAVGDAVYGLIAFGRDGAEAEYAIAFPSKLAPKPRALDHVQAATVTLAALTTWQVLFAHGGLSRGQTVLIHGAAGGVGSYAVQFAHWTGARIVATASSRQSEFLRSLGVDEIIDYTTARFEDVVHDVDLVFDTVGGDTLARSWQVIKKGGAAGLRRQPTPQGTGAPIRGAFLLVHRRTQRRGFAPDRCAARCGAHSAHHRSGISSCGGSSCLRGGTKRARARQDRPAGGELSALLRLRQSR